MRKPQKLTFREEAFIDAYLANGGNGAAAVRAAGYPAKAKGSAAVTAARLLIRANVFEKIAEKRAELRRNADVSTKEVIDTLAAHLRADVTELLDHRGHFDLADVRAKDLGRLIKKVDFRRIPPRKATKTRRAQPAGLYVSKLELYSAQAAANQLCKVLGIEQERGKNKSDPETLKKLLNERIEFGIEGFKRGGVTLTRRDMLQMFSKTPESAGDLYPLIVAELASERVQ